MQQPEAISWILTVTKNQLAPFSIVTKAGSTAVFKELVFYAPHFQPKQTGYLQVLVSTIFPQPVQMIVESNQMKLPID